MLTVKTLRSSRKSRDSVSGAISFPEESTEEAGGGTAGKEHSASQALNHRPGLVRVNDARPGVTPQDGPGSGLPKFADSKRLLVVGTRYLVRWQRVV